MFVWTPPVGAREGEGTLPVDAGKPVLRVEPIVLQPNLLPNASFEDIEAGRPKSWSWDRRNTDAALAIDESVAHFGGRSLRITNSTPFAAHVYGMFHLPGGAAVKPNTQYTFSCYVKGNQIGIAWFGGGREWLQRARFPEKTDGGWVRVVLPFKTGADETNIPVLACTETPCEPFWIDDVQLVEGPRPMPILEPLKSDRPSIYLESPETVVVSRPAGLPALWNAATRLPGPSKAYSTKPLSRSSA